MIGWLVGWLVTWLWEGVGGVWIGLDCGIGWNLKVYYEGGMGFMIWRWGVGDYKGFDLAVKLRV